MSMKEIGICILAVIIIELSAFTLAKLLDWIES
jgi:hypothetical protein